MNDHKYSYRGKMLCLGLLTFTVLLVVSPDVRACQTPVFRYALEKWPGDSYPLMIYHDKPLSKDEKAVADWLEKFQDTEGSQVALYMLDISKPVATQPVGAGATTQPAEVTTTTQPTTQPELSREESRRAYLLEKFPPPKDIPMPAMVFHYPVRPGPEGPIWPVVYAGPLDARIAREMIDSPARQKIARRLLSGDSVVWVLLESGDKVKDDAAAKMLEAELARMNKELKLPEQPDIPDDDIYERKVVVELKLAFSVFRMSRTDPAERMFIKMLLGSEEGLGELKDPMAFPIFGRGRALAAFVGKGIDPDNIEGASAFLIGRCSCQVKNLNPGTDIMFTVNWDAALEGQPLMTVPPLPRFAVDEVDAKDVLLATTQPREAVLEKGSSSLYLVVGICAAAAVVVVGFPMVRVMRKGEGR